MLISIVVTLFNGEKFIFDQINSIFSQSRKADEVLIFDDGSTDRGPQIVKKFIAYHNLRNWIYVKNNVNKGWKANFWDGFKECKGNLIFPCDQDDLWRNDKLEVMENCFKRHDEIQLLASNYETMYEAGAVRISKSFATQCHDLSLRKVEFDHRFMYTLRPGCVFGFRKNFFETIKNFWRPNDPHDTVLWRYAIVMDGLYVLQIPLIKFRRHDNNASSPYKDRNLKSSIVGIHDTLDFLSRMDKYPIVCKNNYLKKILQIRKFEMLRLRFLEGGDVKAFAHIMFRYSKYYLTFKSLLADVFLFVTRRRGMCL